jgi:hypothetical protein
LRLRTKPWLVFALLAAGTLIFLYAIDRYQHRFVRSGPDLLRLLPGDDASVFYAQMQMLRSSGMLALLAGSKTRQEAEYRSFVRATHFDYSKDVDVIAGSVKDDGVRIAIKGRFDWARIRDYVRQQGGSCAADSCHLASGKGETWIGIVRIQPDVLGIALGRSKSLSAAIHPGQQAMAPPLPAEPVWMKAAPGLLHNPAEMPVALRIFAISVQPANLVVVALGAPPPGSPDAFEIKLYAQCPLPTTADTIKSQLQIETKMLKLELAHEHEQPNPADLTGLLTSGTFETNGKEITGEWPVRKELLKTLQQ